MTNLEGALHAAAEEAAKMQHEFEQKTDDLYYQINYVENENIRLKNKLNKASELIRQFADILADDQND